MYFIAVILSGPTRIRARRGIYRKFAFDACVVFRVMASNADVVKIHKVAAEAIHKFSIDDDYNSDPRRTLPDPLNRDRSWLHSPRVHGLLAQIIRNGFTLMAVNKGINVDIDRKRLPVILKHNMDISNGDELLPSVAAEDEPLQTCLGSTHFTTVCRCFIYATKTTKEVRDLGLADANGNLSLDKLKEVDAAFHAYIIGGHKVIRLRSGINEFPKLMMAIQSSSNIKDQMEETEAQLISRATTSLWGVAPDLADEITEQQLQKEAKQLRANMPHLEHYVEPILKFAAKYGNPKAPFIDDMVKYFDEHVNGKSNRSEADFWKAIGAWDSDYGWPAVALAKDNWASDKVKNGVCKGVSVQQANSFKVNGAAKLKAFNEHLISFRKDFENALSTVSARERCRVLGRFDIYSSRVTLQKSYTLAPYEDKPEITWDLKSYADVRLVGEYDIAVLKGTEPPDMSKLLPSSKFPSQQEKSTVGTKMVRKFTAEYNTSGAIMNYKSSLQARGVRKDSTVETSSELVYMPPPPGHVSKKLPPRTKGTVLNVSEDKIMISFNGFGPLTWTLAEYPVEGIVVTKVIAAADEA